MLYLFLSYLYADSGAGVSQGFDFKAFMPFILIFVVFYFLLIRPQQKRELEHKKLLSTLAKGDKVITASGIIAIVNTIYDNEVDLEISNGVLVKVLKNSISEVFGKDGKPKSLSAKPTKTIAEIKKEIKEKSDANAKPNDTDNK